MFTEQYTNYYYPDNIYLCDHIDNASIGGPALNSTQGVWVHFPSTPCNKNINVCQNKNVNVGQLKSAFKTLPE